MKSNFNVIYENPKFLFPYEYGLNEFPFYVDIELTNTCNLNCRMCNRRLMSRRKGFMEWNNYKKAIDEISKYKAGVRFCRHGEPFVHKDIIEMSRYAKERGVLVFISTNGLLLDNNMCRKIVEVHIDELRFSMQGVNRTGYEKMRIGGDYDLFVKNIRLLRKMRDELGRDLPFISLCTSLTDENEEEKEEFKKSWSSIVDSFNIDKTTLARVEHLEDIKEFLPKESVERRYKPCTEIMTKLSVNWNGDITACCKDYDGQLVIGNINEISLKEAWHSERLNTLREIVGIACKHKQIPMCSKCYHVTAKFDRLKLSYSSKQVL